MITAGLDTVCDSNKSKKFYENSVVEDKSILELDDANHELIKDTEFSSLVIKEAVAWQNMHLFWQVNIRLQITIQLSFNLFKADTQNFINSLNSLNSLN